MNDNQSKLEPAPDVPVGPRKQRSKLVTIVLPALLAIVFSAIFLLTARAPAPTPRPSPLLQVEPGPTITPPPVGERKQFEPYSDYPSYMQVVQRHIKRHWFPPKRTTSEEAVALFTVDREGNLKSAEIKQSSGDPQMDMAALEALQRSVPFPPLPAGDRETVDIMFTFDYNKYKGRQDYDRVQEEFQREEQRIQKENAKNYGGHAQHKQDSEDADAGEPAPPP